MGLISLPFPGTGVVWDFSPTNRVFNNLSASQSGQDSTAMLIGDISGNWTAGGGGTQGLAVTKTDGSVTRVQTGGLTATFAAAHNFAKTGEVRSAQAGTSPIDRSSVLVMTSVVKNLDGSATTSWSSVPGKTYQLVCKGRLEDTDWKPVGPTIVAVGEATSASDGTAGSSWSRVYRARLVE